MLHELCYKQSKSLKLMRESLSLIVWFFLLLDMYDVRESVYSY